MLTVSALNQYYGGSHTLRDVAFEAPSGAVTAILGRNGVGKTTLLKCLAGLLPSRSGSIRFDGTDVTKLPPHQRARLGLGYVPQGREIFPGSPCSRISGSDSPRGPRARRCPTASSRCFRC